MLWAPDRRAVLKAGAAAVLAAAAARGALAAGMPSTPEPGPIRMGIVPWLGYGQWQVAAKKGLFGKEGLADVEIVNFTTDADINAALAAGQLQAGNIATHTAMNFIAAGLPIKIVALLDVSKTADAIVSDGSVTDIKGLKGKQVAFEEGTTSEILLNYALAQNGMTIDDIVKVPMPAADAGAALVAGQVPVAVTYEPYLTLAMQQNPKVKMIFSAGESPGLISDVFVVREEFADERPGAIVALLKAWDAALADYKADTPGGRAIIAEAVGAKPEELATAFDGLVYYSLAENKDELAGHFTEAVVPQVKAAALKAGILRADVDLSEAIDGRFVDAAAQ
ncbi:MAG: ABC transporter substrate-binding protein [Amaricoccus sp.]